MNKNEKHIVRRQGETCVEGSELLNPVFGRILANRALTSVSQLAFASRDLLPPAGMSNVDSAAQLIADCVMNGARILIVGDYDADGATSCALGVAALGDMGAKQVNYLVPDRFNLGYGLSEALVELAAKSNPDLIITVDNGIASIDGARRARQLGIRLVITDHHLPGSILPDADAIVNPNLDGDVFPSKHLAGVGVMFYVLSVVRKQLERFGWFDKNRIEQPSLAKYLDLVALGTYADLVKLDSNNRILVSQGLKRINANQCRPGIKALVDVSGLECGQLVASDLGFQLAPKLNAAGRLDDMTIGVECLLEEDPGKARQLALRLDSINQERKDLEKTMQQQALAVIDETRIAHSPDETGLCVFHQDWHQGIVGLVASRLKERRSLPVIAFAPGEGSELKGSARSVPGVHIRDVLCDIDAHNPGLIVQFGGHAMAAGLTIDSGNFDHFKQSFLDALASFEDRIHSANIVLTDGPLDEELDDLGFIRQLRNLAPWGQGFPEPLFDNEFTVLSQRLVGEVHLKLVLRLKDRDRQVDAIHFRYLDTAGAPCPELDRIHAAYRVDINNFAGRISPQLIVEYFKPL